MNKFKAYAPDWLKSMCILNFAKSSAKIHNIAQRFNLKPIIYEYNLFVNGIQTPIHGSEIVKANRLMLYQYWSDINQLWMLLYCP